MHMCIPFFCFCAYVSTVYLRRGVVSPYSGRSFCDTDRDAAVHFAVFEALMLQRAIFLYALFVVAVVASGAAVWQSLETQLREEQLSDATHLLTAARSEARTFKSQAAVAERRIRMLERNPSSAVSSDNEAQQGDEATQPSEEAKLRADLAAARQQLSAAETAIIETEQRLTDEINAHAELKVKAQALADEVAAAGRAIDAAEAKSVRASDTRSKAAATKPVAADAAAPQTAVKPVENIAPGTTPSSTTEATGSLPDSAKATAAPSAAASVGETAPPPAAPPVASAKKAEKKRAKPTVKAVKPIGSPFEPML